MLNKHSLNLTFDGFEVTQALSPHCLIGKKYGLSVSMCLQPSGYSTSTIQHFIVHITYCSFSMKQIIYYCIQIYTVTAKWRQRQPGAPWGISPCPGNGYSRSFSIQTERADLNGSPKMVSDFKHGDPKMDFKWWICFNTPTSWQPQIGKMRFFFTTR